MNNSWKRVTAGLLAFSMVAGTIPANVDWGGLFADSIIGAQAAIPDGAASVEVNDINMGYAYSVHDGETNDYTLTAEAKEGYSFVKWEIIDEDEEYLSYNTITKTIPGDVYEYYRRVKAIFKKDTTVAIGRSFKFSYGDVVGDDVNGDDKYFQVNAAGGQKKISGTTKFTYLGYDYAGNRYVFNCTSGEETFAFSIESPNLGTPWGVQISGGAGSKNNPYTFRILMQAPKTYDATELTKGTVLHVGDRIDATMLTDDDRLWFYSTNMAASEHRKVYTLIRTDENVESASGSYYGLKADNGEILGLYKDIYNNSVPATEKSDGVKIIGVTNYESNHIDRTLVFDTYEKIAEVTTAPVINAKPGRADGTTSFDLIKNKNAVAATNGVVKYAVCQSNVAIPAGAVLGDTVSTSLDISDLEVGHIYRINPVNGLSCYNDTEFLYVINGISSNDHGFSAWLDSDEIVSIKSQDNDYNAFYVNSNSNGTLNITFVKYTDWSETAPTATDPGSYGVWYKAAATTQTAAEGYGDSAPVFLGTSTVVDPTAIFVGNYFKAGDSDNPGATITFYEDTPSYFNTTGDPVEVYGTYNLTWLGYDANTGRHEFKLSGSDDKTFTIADTDSSRPWGLQIASGDGTTEEITFRVLHHEPKEYDATDTALAKDLVLHVGDRIDATMLTDQDNLSFGDATLSINNKAFTLVRTNGQNESPTGEYWGLRRDDGQFIVLRDYSLIRATAKSDGVIITSFTNNDGTYINRTIALANYENVPVVTTAPVINADAGRADGETAFDLIKNKGEVAATNGTVMYSFAKMPEGAVLEDAVPTLYLNEIKVGHVYRVDPDVGLICSNDTVDDYNIICNVDGFGAWINSETSRSIKLPAGYNAFYVNGKSNGTLGITLVKYTDWSATAPTATLPGTYDVMYKAAATASGYQDSYVTFLGTSTVIDPTAMFVGNYFKVGDTINFGTGTYFVWYDDSAIPPMSLKNKTTLVWTSYNSGRHNFDIKYGSGTQYCYISDTDSREPWGIQITGGDGTSDNPYTFRVLHYEPQSYTVTGATYNDRVLHVGDTITVGSSAAYNKPCVIVYNDNTPNAFHLPEGKYELVRYDAENGVTNTGAYYGFKRTGTDEIINTRITVGTSAGLTDSNAIGIVNGGNNVVYYSTLSAYYPPAVTTDPEANKLSYTGVAQALVTAGTAVNGVMQYSLADVTTGNSITVAAPAVGKVYKPTGAVGITFTDQKYITYTAGDVTETVDAYVDNQGANIFYLNNQFYIKSGMAYKSWSTSDYDAVLVTGFTTSEGGYANDTLVVQLVKAADYDWTTTIPAAVKIGQYTVYYRAANTTNGDTSAAKSVNVSIVDTRWTVKFTEESDIVPDDLVFTLKDTASGANDDAKLTADDLEDVVVVDNSGDKPVEKVKVAAGETYYVYTNKEISLKDHDDVVDLQWVTKSKSPYNVAGKLYKYRYKFKTPAPVADATTGAYTASDENVQFVTLDHAHDAAVYTYEANDTAAEKDKLYVICKGEYEQNGQTTSLTNKKVLAAKFNAKDKYYTGDYPDAGDIVLTNEEDGEAEIYGATIKRKDIEILYYDKDGKTIASGELETGKKYVVKATIPVDIDGYVVTPVISAEFVYEALPLYSANAFYKELNPDYDATAASSSKYVQVEVDNPAYVSVDETPGVPAKITVDKETKLKVKHRDKMIQETDEHGAPKFNTDGTPKMIVSMIPNPAYVSEAETPDVDKTIAEQEYYVEVPDFTTYNEAEQGMPVIVLRNPSNNMEAYVVEPETIAEGHYPSNLISDTAYTITGDDKGTNAGTYKATLTAAEGKGYSDALTVDWTIAKAELKEGDLTAAAKDDIVYDGAIVDKSDFTFGGTKTAVMDEATTTVEAEGFYTKATFKENETVHTYTEILSFTPSFVKDKDYLMVNPGTYTLPAHENADPLFKKKTFIYVDEAYWPQDEDFDDPDNLLNGGKIPGSNSDTVTLNNDNSITYKLNGREWTIGCPAGYVWAFEIPTGDNVSNYNIRAVKLNDEYKCDAKSAGKQITKLTIKSKNYNDEIIYVGAYNINKRKATVGVGAENASMTYGEKLEDEDYISLAKSAVDNHFIYESAKTKTENNKTVITNDSGIVAADADVIFSTTAATELQVKLDKFDENRNGKIDDNEKITFKYGDKKNDAGKYAYTWADVNENDDRFKYLENYDITFATVTTDGKFSDEFMFTVKPKALSSVKEFRFFSFDELMDKMARANVTISKPAEVAKPNPETLPARPANMPVLSMEDTDYTTDPRDIDNVENAKSDLAAIDSNAVNYGELVKAWHETYKYFIVDNDVNRNINYGNWENNYDRWESDNRPELAAYLALTPINGTTRPEISDYVTNETDLASLATITNAGSEYFDADGHLIAEKQSSYNSAIGAWVDAANQQSVTEYEKWQTQFDRWENLTKWNADKAAYETYQGKLEAYNAAKMAADGTSDDVAYPFAEPTAPEVVTEPATQPADLLSTMPVLAAPTAGDFSYNDSSVGQAIYSFPSAENYKNNPDGYAQAIANWYSNNTNLNWNTDSTFLANYSAWSDDTENATDASFYKWKATYDESVASLAAYEMYQADVADYEVAHAEWVKKYNAARMDLMVKYYNTSVYETDSKMTTATQMFNGKQQFNPALRAAMVLDGKTTEDQMWAVLMNDISADYIKSGIVFNDGVFTNDTAELESDDVAKMTADDFTVVTTPVFNILPGTYTNKFKGTGNYTGTATLTWEIVGDNTIKVTVDVVNEDDEPKIEDYIKNADALEALKSVETEAEYIAWKQQYPKWADAYDAWEDDYDEWDYYSSTYNGYDIEENERVNLSFAKKKPASPLDNDQGILTDLTTTDEITTFNTLKSLIEELKECTTQEAYNSKLAAINALVTGTDKEPGAYQQLVGMVVAAKLKGFNSEAPYNVLYDFSNMFDEEYFEVRVNNGACIASVAFDEENKKVVITTDSEYGYVDVDETALPDDLTTSFTYYQLTNEQYTAVLDGEAKAEDFIATDEQMKAGKTTEATLTNIAALVDDYFTNKAMAEDSRFESEEDVNDYIDEYSLIVDDEELLNQAADAARAEYANYLVYKANYEAAATSINTALQGQDSPVGTLVPEGYEWDENQFTVTGVGSYVKEMTFDAEAEKINVTLVSTPMNDKPVDSGKYAVKATTKAKGYVFNDSYDVFSIDPVQLKVTIDDDAMSKTYGQLDPSEIEYEYNDWRIVSHYDEAAEKLVDEDVKLEGTIGIAPMYDEEDGTPEAQRKTTAYRDAGFWKYDFNDLTLTGKDLKGENGNDNYVIVNPYAEYPEMDDHYSFDAERIPENVPFFTVERQLLKDENVSGAPVLANGETPIMGTQVTVKGEFEELDADGKVVKTTKPLTKNTDFVSYSATMTSEEGKDIPVHVKGVGNFAGFAEGKYDAISVDEVNVDAKVTIEDKANRKLRITVKTTEDIENLDVVEIGYILYRGTECPDEMTIEAAEADANDTLYNVTTTGTAITGTTKDSKGGVHYVPYYVLSNEQVVYKDVVSTTLEKAIDDAKQIKATVTPEDIENNKIRITVKSVVTDAKAASVKKTGYILFRGSECPEEMTIEAAEADANDTLYNVTTTGTAITGTTKDSKGGVYFVPYSIYDDDTIKYFDVVKTSAEEFKNDRV